MNVRVWMGGAFLALVISILAVTGRSRAADEKQARDVILKMANALQKGDDAGAKKMAAELNDNELEDIMNLLMPRRQKNGKVAGGIGVGAKPGSIMPDGIEKKFEDIQKNGIKAEEVADVERAGYVLRAVSLTTPGKLPKGKPPANWKKYCAEFEKLSKVFTDVAKTKDTAKIQAAVKNLNNVCAKCHDEYK